MNVFVIGPSALDSDSSIASRRARRAVASAVRRPTRAGSIDSSRAAIAGIRASSSARGVVVIVRSERWLRIG